MPKFICNKLGRNKSPDGFESQGIKTQHVFLQGKKLGKELMNKLIEEAHEVKAETSNEGLAEELADLLEVVDALCVAYKIDPQEVMRVKKEKHAQLGGFERGFYVEYIQMDDNNSRAAHFRASPDKYPEE